MNRPEAEGSRHNQQLQSTTDSVEEERGAGGRGEEQEELVSEIASAGVSRYNKEQKRIDSPAVRTSRSQASKPTYVDMMNKNGTRKARKPPRLGSSSAYA